MVLRIDIPQIGRGVVEATWHEEAFESVPHALCEIQVGWYVTSRNRMLPRIDRLDLSLLVKIRHL
jgi:hypothetical protein